MVTWPAALRLTAGLTLIHACAGPSGVRSQPEGPAASRPAVTGPGQGPGEAVGPKDAPMAAPGPKDTLRPALPLELLPLRARAQALILGAGNEIEDASGATALSPPADPDAGLPPRSPGNALGHFVPVENEAALSHFHRALRELERGERPDGKLRVLVYGASHTQGDFLTGYLRYYLQSRFGDGGPGFLQLAKLNRSYRKLDIDVKSSGFRVEHAQSKKQLERGRFGLLGAVAVAHTREAFARIVHEPKRGAPLGPMELELYYLSEPRGGDFTLAIDGRPKARISARSAQVKPSYERLDAPLGFTKLEVKPAGNGKVRIFGVSLERPGDGIVIDTLGINGTRAANLLEWDETLWAAHVARRDPRLVLLAYGTNEATDAKEPISVYEENLRRVLARLGRAAPLSSCVLVGPGDFPKAMGSEWVSRERVDAIVAVQRRVALEAGCGFWDTLSFMGGQGSMDVWATASPLMASRDHVHFTVRGYVKVGMALGDALMRAFDAERDTETSPARAASSTE